MLAFHKIWDRLAEQFHLVAIDLAAGVQGPAGIAELIGFPVLPKACYASGPLTGGWPSTQGLCTASRWPSRWVRVFWCWEQ
jgi:hypothetical protein